MKQFDKDRIIECKICIRNEIFPFIEIKPIKKTSTLVIFLCGLNSNSSFIKYFDNNCFDNVHLISFDPRAQAKNEMKSSKKYTQYLKDLKNILEYYLKKNTKIEKIYLLGESWGSSIAFLFNKYYPQKVNGVFGWNMPYEIIDTSTKENKNIFLKFKVVITLITNIETYAKSVLSENTTNNKALKKLIINSQRKKLSNKVIIASWRSFKKSWKYLINNPDKNLMYLQSKEDILMSQKIFNKKINKKNILFLERGTHLLSFDINESKTLFKYIKEFIEK